MNRSIRYKLTSKIIPDLVNIVLSYIEKPIFRIDIRALTINTRDIGGIYNDLRIAPFEIMLAKPSASKYANICAPKFPVIYWLKYQMLNQLHYDKGNRNRNVKRYSMIHGVTYVRDIPGFFYEYRA